MDSANLLLLVLLCGVAGLAYGVWAIRSVLSASPGNARMQEIAAAIQEGASAYLSRQYTTISFVAVVVAVIVGIVFGPIVAVGFVIGAVMSGAAGYIGMLVSVRANVRTTEASRKGLAQGLAIAFKSGASTGMLVVGLALIAMAGYYALLTMGMGYDVNDAVNGRKVVEGLVALSLGASVISIFARLGGGIFTKGA
ncbi:MAG TPA: sodium-translocating pyrophosphatase, partial [Alphaproteobacteria bacterium]|nr:sodium-translocating pyrophosphatase [Alphaproteobacteria bacterium]